jgi:HupE / UreJ protein
MRTSWLAMLLFVFAGSASAHKPSDSYLMLSAHPGDSRVSGQWDIALRDLDLALDLDVNRDGAIDWRELRTRERDLFGYALARLDLTGDAEPCPIVPGELLVDDHSDGAYAVLRFSAQCARPLQRLGVAYRLLFDLDATHRGLLRLDAGGESRTAVLSPEVRDGPAQATQQFDLAQTSRLATFAQFVGDGMHHIWIGYDHMLFLISLLLPAVLIRRERAWQPVPSLKSALLGVLAVVTAFTVSHSITLTLAALDVIGLPSRLVESAIALSVLLASVNNIWPIVTRRGWVLAFCFGLVHGFGFASVLGDLGLPRDALALALAGFNVGVEIGQLTVVLAVVPLTYILRNARFYRPGILVGGSSAIALIAGVWFIGRAFGLGLG